MKKRILIVFGGCSTEYKVSLTSASSVLAALDRGRWEALLLGITEKGQAF